MESFEKLHLKALVSRLPLCQSKPEKPPDSFLSLDYLITHLPGCWKKVAFPLDTTCCEVL